MRWTLRILAVTRWGLTIAAVVAAAALVITGWRVWLWGVTPKLMFSFVLGRLEIRTSEHPSQGEPWNPLIRRHILGSVDPHGWQAIRWGFQSSYDQYGHVVAIPLWAPCLLFTLAASPLWIAHALIVRRRRGLCPRRGYDRRGLAADVKCPECGAVPAT